MVGRMEKIENKIGIVISMIFGVLAVPELFLNYTVWQKALFIVVYVGIVNFVFGWLLKKWKDVIHFSTLAWGITFFGVAFLVELLS